MIRKLKTTILPVSVLEIDPQQSTLREGTKHSRESSRSSFSPCPREVCMLVYELYLKNCQRILDPFAGWGERGFYAKQYNKRYSGFDINPEAIKYAIANYDVYNICADSRDVFITGEWDGIFTSPPYWNLEKYTESPEDLSNAPTLEEFNDSLLQIMKRIYSLSKVGTMFCILVGDFRKENKYYNISYLVERMFIDNLNAELVDKVIVSRRKVSKISIMIPQALRLGYTVKVHEYLYIFKKGGELDETVVVK